MKNESKFKSFFSVIAKPQTYTNIFYLLLSFPLGITYFVLLITLLSVGLGLMITLIGFPLLILTLLISRNLGHFERLSTITLLNTKTKYKKPKKEKTILKQIKALLQDSYTWRSLIFLFLKFPLGIIAFVLITTLLSTSLALISIPIVYYLTQIGIITGAMCSGQFCNLLNYPTTIFTSIIGLLLLFSSLHIFNGLAKISSKLSTEMLQRK